MTKEFVSLSDLDAKRTAMENLMVTTKQWRHVKVGDVCEKVGVGIVIQPSQYYVEPGQGVRAFRSANVGVNKIIDRDWVYLSQEGHRLNAKSALKKGDVLVVRSGALAGNACVVTQDYANLNCIDTVIARPKKEELHPEYLAQFTNSAVGQQHVLSSKVGQALSHFNVGAFKALEMPLPSIKEQEIIINLLSDWDIAMNCHEKLIAAKEEQYIHQLSCLIIKAKHPTTSVQSFALEISERNRRGTETVLSVTNSRGFVLPEEQFERRIASADLSNYKVVRRGQYAYNPSRINVGSIARLENWQEGVLSPMYVVFALDTNQVDSDYFLHWLNSRETRQRIKSSAQGSVRESVSFGDFAALYFPIPKLEHQSKIASYLNCLREEITLLQKKNDHLMLQKCGLMQRLLTGDWRLPLTETSTH